MRKIVSLTEIQFAKLLFYKSRAYLNVLLAEKLAMARQ